MAIDPAVSTGNDAVKFIAFASDCGSVRELRA